MTDIYLNINKDTFESQKKEAESRDVEQSGEDSTGYLFNDCSLSDEQLECKNGEFELYGDLIDNLSKEVLGYLSITIRPDMDLVIDLIEFYMKKLGKLKTVLEATK